MDAGSGVPMTHKPLTQRFTFDVEQIDEDTYLAIEEGDTLTATGRSAFRAISALCTLLDLEDAISSEGNAANE